MLRWEDSQAAPPPPLNLVAIVAATESKIHVFIFTEDIEAPSEKTAETVHACFIKFKNVNIRIIKP